MDYDKIIAYFHETYKNLQDKERAIQEKSYLKSPFIFYGVPVQQTRRCTHAFFREHRDMSKEDIWKLQGKFWNSGWHELRRTALHMLRFFQKRLGIEDMTKLEEMLQTSTNWDQVDEIAAHLVGGVLEKNWDKGKQYLIRWSIDKNFWMRRASMLSMLIIFRKESLPQNQLDDAKKLFFHFAKNMLDEENYADQEYTTQFMPKKMGIFFIRKCIGWVLREMSQKDHESVIHFVNSHKMSGLSFREATRKLSGEDKEKLNG